MTVIEASNQGDETSAKAMPHDNDSGNGSVANSFLFFFLVLLIVLTPLPFGGARPWAHALIGIWVGVLSLGCALTSRIENTGAQKSLTWPTILLASVVCFIVLQANTFTPLTWQHRIWREAEQHLGHGLLGAISLDPAATYAGLTKWLSYAGVFYLAFTLGGDRKRARSAILIVAICGGVYAAYGLIAYWSGNQYVLWFPKWTYNSDLTGPFINRNSFATFLGLSILATLALLSDDIDRARAAPQQIVPRRLHTLASFVIDHAWLVMLFFVLLTALLLTHSRGGFLSTAVGSAALFGALQRAKNRFSALNFRLIIPAVCFAALALLISGERLVDRMATSDQDTNGRITIYKTGLEEIGQNPVAGSGLGSFPAVFQLHRTPDFLLGEVTKAHSDYIETIADLGIPAALILFLTIAWLAGICIRGTSTRQRDVSWPSLGVGASALVAVHAVFDFSLQIPAVAVTYFLLLGIAVAQSHSTRTTVSSSS